MTIVLSIRASNLLIINAICDPIWIRTKGLRFRKPLLYPAELWDQNKKSQLTNL